MKPQTNISYAEALAELAQDSHPDELPLLVLAAIVSELNSPVVVVAYGEDLGRLPQPRAARGVSLEDYLLVEKFAFETCLESLRDSKPTFRIHEESPEREALSVPFGDPAAGLLYVEHRGGHSGLQERTPWLLNLASSLKGALQTSSKEERPPVKRWHSLRQKGLKYFRKQAHKTSELLLRAALELVRQHEDLGLQRARSQNDLALLKASAGQLEAAELLFQKAVAGFEELAHLNSTDRPACLNNLGGLYLRMGKPELAEVHFLQAAELLEAQDDEHPKLVPIMCNLAALYDNRGLLDMASLLFGRAVDVATKKLPPEHPDLRRCLRRFQEFNAKHQIGPDSE